MVLLLHRKWEIRMPKDLSQQPSQGILDQDSVNRVINSVSMLLGEQAYIYIYR